MTNTFKKEDFPSTERMRYKYLSIDRFYRQSTEVYSFHWKFQCVKLVGEKVVASKVKKIAIFALFRGTLILFIVDHFHFRNTSTEKFSGP